MQLKLSVLLSVLFLGGGCYAAYVPDHSLKKAWNPELENTQPSKIPYAAIYKVGPKKLIYIAASLENRAQTDSIIESLIEKDKPQVVLLQGHEKGKTVDPSKVKFHLKEYTPPLKGASASQNDILQHLSRYGVSERDYILFQAVNLANQRWMYESPSPQDLEQKINHYLQTDLAAKKYHLTYKDVQAWFQKNMGIPLTYEVLVEGELVAPKDPQLKSTTYLQKISTYEDQVDDKIVMNTLADALDKNNVVMVIRAASKYVVESPVLHHMLGVSSPTEIVN